MQSLKARVAELQLENTKLADGLVLSLSLSLTCFRSALSSVLFSCLFRLLVLSLSLSRRQAAAMREQAVLYHAHEESLTLLEQSRNEVLALRREIEEYLFFSLFLSPIYIYL